jgi:hypothetical protein
VQIITGEFVLLAGLCLLVQGWTASRRLLVVLSAVPLAACVYTYHATRIAPLVAFAYVAAAVWERRRAARAGAPPAGVGSGILVLTLLVFIAALGPAIVGYVREPGALTSRVNETSIWVIIGQEHSWQPLWEATWRTLGMFHYQQGPEYHWFGLGFDPAFNLVVGALVAHGEWRACSAGARRDRCCCSCGSRWDSRPGSSPAAHRASTARCSRRRRSTCGRRCRSRRCSPSRGCGRCRRCGRRRSRWPSRSPSSTRSTTSTASTASGLPLVPGQRIVEMARTLRRYGPGWNGYLMADNFDAGHETFRFLSRPGIDVEPVSSLADVLPLNSRPRTAPCT